MNLDRAYCPSCLCKVEGAEMASGGEQRPPQPGDITLCVECGEFGLFTQSMTMAKLPMSTFKQLPAQQKFSLLMAQAAIRAVARAPDIPDIAERH